MTLFTSNWTTCHCIRLRDHAAQGLAPESSPASLRQPPGKTLARAMLRSSLHASLARVLKALDVDAAAVDFSSLVDADGRPGAILAVSSIVIITWHHHHHHYYDSTVLCSG